MQLILHLPVTILKLKVHSVVSYIFIKPSDTTHIFFLLHLAAQMQKINILKSYTSSKLGIK